MNTKTIIISIIFFLNAVCVTHAQINRTLETKVADILAQMPANNLEKSDRLMEEIIGLKTEGILQFCDMLVPLGTGDDTQVRFALHSLAIYQGGKQNPIGDNIVENSFLIALEKATDNEIKTFLIRRLNFCGTNASIHSLEKYLSNKNLYIPAIGALISIGTQQSAAAILESAEKADPKMQPEFIDALGSMKYEPALKLLDSFAGSTNILIKQKSLMALAKISNESSNTLLYNAAKNANFNKDESKAIQAYILYGENLSKKGNKILSSKIAENLMKNCTAENQLYFRAAAIDILKKNQGSNFTKTLIKEAKNKNNIYRGAVIEAARINLTHEDVLKWVKAYKKSSNEAKPQIIRLLRKRKESEVINNCILPATKNKDINIRVAGIKALDYQKKEIALPTLLALLQNASSIEEYNAIEETLLKVCDAKDNEQLAQKINQTNNQGKVVLINVLAARNATSEFNTIVSLRNNSNTKINTAIYAALPSIASENELPKLIEMLDLSNNDQDLKFTQEAIIKVLDNSSTDHSQTIFNNYNSESKIKILPVFSAIDSKKSLDLVVKSLNEGAFEEKKVALETLANWRSNKALPYLFQVASTSDNKQLSNQAFNNYLSKVDHSSYPKEQKLLLIEKLAPFCKSNEDKKAIIKKARNVKTFLSLVFISKYLNNDALIATASNAAIRIALPTPGKRDGLSGDVVRDIVTRSVNNLTGRDSQYIKIDVKEFLENMSNEKGFIPIFNGKDLSGWEGLVKNPIERNKMSAKELASAQKKANEKMHKDWFVKDGIIQFKGEGYDNICTIKDYGDFEMLVDWKITDKGDSGIYLRGTPQVQIWDIARVDAGAQVGSGGLYNNKVNQIIPLKVADNPVNEWNNFRIKMIGEKVTVYLNGVLVTDNVTLENYWDRALPIFSKEAIELQAHGENLGFRNIYVREISSGDNLLSEEERQNGFKSLFNGKDLDLWVGNKIDYYAENNELLARPVSKGGHGNFFTANEYADFVFRFEFKLTPGANNGVGIHAPLKGDAAYEGKEIQILDNTAAIYANLKPYQYHGSVYGIIPAKRGFLKPVGEWNDEEIYVKGEDIKVTLNGTVIVDGNITNATKNGTMDHKDHPGLKRHKGHIGFLGHGSELDFRNIRIKDLSNSK